MTGKSPTSLIQGVIASAGVDHGTAIVIATDFLALDVSKHDEPGREIEKTFMACHKPGFDAYSFRLFLKSRYSLTDKQSTVVLRGFQYKCNYHMNSNRAMLAGISEGTWAFPGKCDCIDGNLHSSLHGQNFRLSGGVSLNGQPIKPGESWLCCCGYRPTLAALEEKKPSLLSRIKRMFFKEKPEPKIRITTKLERKNGRNSRGK